MRFLKLIKLLLGFALFLTPATAAQSITRVNVDSAGVQADKLTYQPSISDDGRFIAFRSLAGNLVPGDTNQAWDIFVHDRLTSETTRVSVDSFGNQAFGHSEKPAISADGLWVVFTSEANNLIVGDFNFNKDIFLHNRTTGETSRVSVSSAGLEGNWDSRIASISADGQFLAFQSRSSNLVPGDTNATYDIFVHNRISGQTSLVSKTSAGVQGNNISGSPSLSGDGRFVAFDSLSSNLVPADTNVLYDVFVHDRFTGITTRISESSLGLEGNGPSQLPSISADGALVAFQASASNLVSGDTNAATDIFLHDRNTATTSRVSISSAGAQGTSGSTNPSISSDGRFVGFTANSSNLVPGDTNSRSDILLRDLSSAETIRVSLSSAGMEGNLGTYEHALSGDGRFIAMRSDANNLIPGDTNSTSDILLRDRLGPSLTKQGTCTSTLTFTISGGVMGQNIALIYGASGSFTKPYPPCQGVVLNIAQPTLAAIFPTSSSGIATITIPAPPGACGLTIQAVDMGSCAVTNSLVL